MSFLRKLPYGYFLLLWQPRRGNGQKKERYANVKTNSQTYTLLHRMLSIGRRGRIRLFAERINQQTQRYFHQNG